MPKKVTVYTMDYCPFCERAKSLLKSRNISFSEIRVSMDDEAKWIELEKKSGLKTMPQIFVDDVCLGGFTELDALDRSGGLAGAIS